MNPELKEKLKSMAEKMERQTAAIEAWSDQNRERIEAAVEANQERCEIHQIPLDIDIELTLEASFRLVDEEGITFVWRPCSLCEQEAEQNAQRERWLKLGIPKRVVDATAKGFVIPSANNEHAEHASKMRQYKEAVRDWAINEPSTTFLICCGKPGVGKSHMAAAMLKYFHDQGMRGGWIRWSDFVREHRRGYNDSSRNGVALQVAQQTPFLVIDDVIPSKGADEFELWTEVIDKRHDDRLRTIITTNESAESLMDNCISHKGAVDRVRSDSLILELQWPSYRK